MSRWFSSSRDRRDARRGSDHTADELQYTTSRGLFPVEMVDDIGAELNFPEHSQQSRYPHHYLNQAEPQPFGKPRKLFDDYETLDDEERLWEFPVTRPGPLSFKMKKTPANFRKVNAARTRMASDLMNNRPNDPGPVRGVIPAYDDLGEDDPRSRRRRPPIGVIYHPEGDARHFSRARLDPLDREGRAMLHRWEDELYVAPLRRTGTWPPRDEDADALTTYETRYEPYAPLEERYYQPPPKSRNVASDH